MTHTQGESYFILPFITLKAVRTLSVLTVLGPLLNVSLSVSSLHSTALDLRPY